MLFVLIFSFLTALFTLLALTGIAFESFITNYGAILLSFLGQYIHSARPVFRDIET